MRQSFKFGCKGLDLVHPYDLMPTGSYPILKNLQVNMEGVLSTRLGTTALNATPLSDTNIHSIRRLNNSVANDFTRIVGAGASLYTGKTSFSVRDTGYSGNPLSIVPFRPDQTPNPWAYIADASRMRKIDYTGLDYSMGIIAPTAAPVPAIGNPNYAVISNFDTAAAWTAAGTAGALSNANRINTVIAASGIIYDSGTTGWASVLPNAVDSNIQPGMLVAVGAENVRIDEVYPPISTTTISSILYDSGTTGPCTISLTAQSVGLVPNCVVQFGGEYIRVLSVTFGPDNLPSFRCSTASNHVAGEAVYGTTSVRIFFGSAHAAGEAIVSKYTLSAVTVGTGTISVTGSAVNLAVINSRPTTPDDLVHISILMDNPANLVEGRVIIDFGDASFTKNYYYKTFRASDFQPSVSSLLTSTTTSQQAVQRQIIDDSVAQESTPPTDYQTSRSDIFPANEDVPVSPPGAGLVASDTTTSTSDQTVTGVSQWTELVFRLSDMTRVGADQTKTLKDANAFRIQFLTSATLNVQVDDWWVGGTYGADVGSTGAPILYAYRYRSSATGAISNPSPVNRSGINPKRERVYIYLTQSSDSQVDKIDLFRFGGGLNQWRWVLTCDNRTQIVADEIPNSTIVTNPTLEFDNYRPFPVSDLPKTGTCQTSGTSIKWLTGDTFNVNWVPGTQIIINNIPYTLYANPTSTTRLETVESVGTNASVSFFMPEPTLEAQPLPAMWSFGGQGLATYLLGVGDPYSPGFLRWTKGNSPDTASDKGNLEITSPSEPLLNGFTYDGRTFVFSSERLFNVFPDPNTTFSAQEVPNGKGLISRFAFCVGAAVWFVNRTGVHEWNGGAPQSITEDSLYPLFPHDGVTGSAVNGYQPIDFTKADKIRLNYSDNFLYLLYVDTANNRQCMRYDLRMGRRGWFPFTFTPQPQLVYMEEGSGVESTIYGGGDGVIRQFSSSTTDSGTAIDFQVRTPAMDCGDTRAQKLFTEFMFDGQATVTLSPFYNITTTAPVFAFSEATRAQDSFRLSDASLTLYRNLCLDISGSGPADLYEFQLNAEIQPYLSTQYIAQAVDHGFTSFGHLRESWMGLISLDTVTLSIVSDGTTYTYTFPSTGGTFMKVYRPLAPIKGKLQQYMATCPSEFCLFPGSTIINLKPWGDPGPYRPFQPFAQLINSGVKQAD